MLDFDALAVFHLLSRVDHPDREVVSCRPFVDYRCIWKPAPIHLNPQHAEEWKYR